jgi:hypothetical protein
MYEPDEVVEMSDRVYIADQNGSLRVAEYKTPPTPPVPNETAT